MCVWLHIPTFPLGSTTATNQSTFSLQRSEKHSQTLCKWFSHCTNITHIGKSRKQEFAIHFTFTEAAKSISIRSSGRTVGLTWDPDRSNEKIPWEQTSASLPELTNPISLFTLVLHKVQLWRGWWTFPLQLLTQLELLRPQPLLSA